MKTGVSGNRSWQETRKYGHLIQEYVSFQYQVLRSQAFQSSSKHSEQSHSRSVIGDRDSKGEPTSVEDRLARGASQFIYSSDDSNLVSARHRVKGCEAEGISSVQEIAVVVSPLEQCRRGWKAWHLPSTTIYFDIRNSSLGCYFLFPQVRTTTPKT
jgi:hypothetical protein